MTVASASGTLTAGATAAEEDAVVTSLEGKLLVATPVIEDGVFDRSVILLLEHGEDGAMGLVLNEPSDTPLAEALPDWGPVAADPALVFVGGPVDRSVVFGLGRSSSGATDAWQPIVGPVGIVDLSRDPVMVGVPVETVRLYVGYAGWSPGQLEAELDAGAWLVVDAEPGDAFTPDPEDLWRQVLRRQPGAARLLSTYPPDPSLN